MKYMNQISINRKLAGVVTSLWVACLLQGCAVMINPHSTERSGEVWGRVLDALTHYPINGAKVYFIQGPPQPTFTDTNGCFHIKATRDFNWMSGADGSGRKMATRNISHTNYVTRTGDWEGDVGNIFLQPKP